MLYHAGRSRLRAALAVAVAFAAAGLPLDAQRRGRVDAPPKSSPSMSSVRAEMAAVLLQSKKYDEAAREYRTLLSRDTANVAYRLGLARALAWGGQARAAERELRALQAKNVQLATIDSLLRTVREAMDPTSSEAATWVAERATYAPYRVALARALVKEHRGGPAAAQYDTLLAGAPTAGLFNERARLRLIAGDTVGAESDIRAGLQLAGTAAGYLMLGDLYRERGDFGRARSMYGIALSASHESLDDRMAADAAIAGLGREERPVIAFVPTAADDPGWRVTSEGVGDNLGVRYASSTLQRTEPIGDVLRVGVALKHHYLGERSPARSIDLTAVGVEGSLAGQVGYGPFLGRAEVSGGALHLPTSQSIPVGSVTAAAWLFSWVLAAEASTSAAYPSLLTTTAVRPLTGTASVLTEHTTAASLGGPIGPADVAARAQQTRLSDGNTRKTLEAYARVAVMPGVYVAYGASRITFAARSSRYWTPIDYAAQGAGLELATRNVYGLSAAIRALPGEAWSKEAPPPSARTSRRTSAPPPIDRRVFQISSGGELAWRDPHWEAAAAVTYGSGRTGAYRRGSVALGVRFLR